MVWIEMGTVAEENEKSTKKQNVINIGGAML